MNNPSIHDLQKSASRELKMRESCYPRWEQSGRMTQEEAEHELSCQRAIVSLLSEKVDQEQGQGSLFNLEGGQS